MRKYFITVTSRNIPNKLSLPIEAAVRKCSSKQPFLKILQYSQETPVLESLFMFPREFCKIKCFYKTPLVAASVSTPYFFLK